ncbi:MAG: hypothetical protein IPM37_13640 [Hahellaceae bacterium]|nr:hypothetical protein [Hahellaceae bacterium]
MEICEVKDFSTYVNKQVLFDLMGFARQPNQDVLQGFVTSMVGAYGASLHQIAKGLGVRVSKIDSFIQTYEATKEFEIVAGQISKGTISAIRYGFDAYVNGEIKLQMTRINRLNDAQAPEWPKETGYTIKVDGEPSFTMHFEFATEPGRDPLRDSTISAAARAVNTIGAVCNAPPGIRSALELQMVVGRGAM